MFVGIKGFIKLVEIVLYKIMAVKEVIMKYKASIIVSVYNVEKYLRECLDSLVNQTLKVIEIIFINDASLL